MGQRPELGYTMFALFVRSFIPTGLEENSGNRLRMKVEEQLQGLEKVVEVRKTPVW